MEKVAARVGMTVEAFAAKKTVLMGALLGDRSSTVEMFVPRPAIKGEAPGGVADPTREGECIFYERGRCSIHKVKPTECCDTDHNTTPTADANLRMSLINKWLSRRDQLTALFSGPLRVPIALYDKMRSLA